ncbi:MAG: sulfurtransferase [Flavobacteriaceae bacterium]|nr:sulfurtransferase [Flavobacteriaceae bacterium]|tara:strand:- start:17608 stop:18540 length:933 start_codon:yes stop_codon:yes gene_type:complete
MNWKISSIVLLLLLTSCQKKEVVTENKKSKYLITSNEFMKLHGQQNVKIIDFRKDEIYQKGHIPGAVQLWRDDVQNSSFPYVGMMASVTQIEELFSNMGISNQDLLVVYDDRGLCEAARFWWILQNYNFDNVRLLEGGLEGWKAANGAVSTQTPNLVKSNFSFEGNPQMKYYISKDQVAEAINKNYLLLDTRSIDEFTGIQHKKGAAKAGRIKNSVHMDWAEAIHYDTDKSIKSIDELEKIYSRLNAKKTDSIILYCHSGVRSAHTTFVLSQLLGYKNVWNYDGSWTEWSHFEELPYENGSLTLTTIKNE